MCTVAFTHRISSRLVTAVISVAVKVRLRSDCQSQNDWFVFNFCVLSSKSTLDVSSKNWSATSCYV